MGLRDSGLSRPRMKSGISSGTRVIARIDEQAIASVFVQASGVKRRPSGPSSRNTGRNETMMMIREKKSAGATCSAAPSRSARRPCGAGAAGAAPSSPTAAPPAPPGELWAGNPSPPASASASRR